MTFRKRSRSHFYKSCVFPELVYGCATRVAHTCAKSAHKLEYNFGKRAAVGNASFYAFGYEFLGVRLEISVLAALCHCGKRTHSAIGFKTSALINFKFARRLGSAREKRAYHYCATACGKSFYYIAGIFNAAVGYYAFAQLIRFLRAVKHRRKLRHTYARYYTRRADRAGTYAYLNYVRARAHKVVGGFRGNYVAGNERQVGVRFFNLFNRLYNARRMPVRRVENPLWI